MVLGIANAGTVLVALLVFIPVAVFALPMFAAGSALLQQSPGRQRSRLLWPAEARVIADTPARISAPLRPQGRILVVADNCSDDTASIARGLGAEAVERHDALRRGTGYALAHGVAHLQALGAPARVVIVDADCSLGLARAGAAPTLCEPALTTRTLASTTEAEAGQHRRWEQGPIGQMLNQEPRLSGSALRARDLQQLYTLLDLSVPLVVVLVVLVVLATALASLVLVAVGLTAPVLTALPAFKLLLLGIALVLAWRHCGRDLLAAAGLAQRLLDGVMTARPYAAMRLSKRQAGVQTRRGG